jgi:hypothetical protein
MVSVRTCHAGRPVTAHGEAAGGRIWPPCLRRSAKKIAAGDRNGWGRIYGRKRRRVRCSFSKKAEEKLCGGDMSWNGSSCTKRKNAGSNVLTRKAGGQRYAFAQAAEEKTERRSLGSRKLQNEAILGSGRRQYRRDWSRLCRLSFAAIRPNAAKAQRSQAGAAPRPLRSRFQAPTAAQVTRRMSARNAAEAAST